MDYHSTKYSFGELSEHITKLESKFHLSNNLCAKEAFTESLKLNDDNILSLNQKGFSKNGFSLSEPQNAQFTGKSHFENVSSVGKCENSKSDKISEISDKYRTDRMRPQEETNYIVKLEKMSAEETMCRKKNDTKDKWPPGKKNEPPRDKTNKMACAPSEDSV